LRFTIDVVVDSITGSVPRPEYSADENGALIRAGSGEDIKTMGEDVAADLLHHNLNKSRPLAALSKPQKNPAPYRGFSM